jgi:hypothetical protein
MALLAFDRGDGLDVGPTARGTSVVVTVDRGEGLGAGWDP